MIGAGMILAGVIASATVPLSVRRQALNNYPEWAQRAGKSSAVTMEMIVEPDGKIRECSVVSFVGDERLAREQCEMFEGRKLDPAVGSDGKPILSKYRTFFIQSVQGSRQRTEVERAKRAPDLTLEVSELPKNAEGAFELGIDVLVDATGAVKLCEPESRFEDTVRAEYVDLACREATKLMATPLATQAGDATDYVTNMTVRFEVDRSS